MLGERAGEISTTESARLYERASRVAPGGIQGAARHWDPYPIYFQRAHGGHVTDVDGNEYVDLWAAAGPIVLGHNDARVWKSVVERVSELGVLFCLPHEQEVVLAEEICAVVPSAEKVVFGCGGSDVCLFAVRAARRFTGRQKLVKCEGAYHGWNDPLLVSVWPALKDAGADDAIEPVQDSSGLSSSTLEECFIVPFNDADAFDQLATDHGSEIAAFFIEPVLHTPGCILPEPGYLEAVREICDREGILLVFDEIITGFRHHVGGYQVIADVKPDLTTLGKAMSNGFPISALAGRDDVMSVLSPLGSAYYSGTFMGQMLLVTAGLQTLRALRDGSVHERLFAMGDHLAERVCSTIDRLGVNASFQHLGSIWSLYLGTREATNYRDVAGLGHPKDGGTQALRRYLRNNGYYLHPPTRRAYLMDAHTESEIDRLAGLIEEFLTEHRDLI